MEIDWAGIIEAIGIIIIGWFTYNQYTKNKFTDMKVEQMQKDQEIKRKRRADNSATIYGELWEVLHNLQADRVYIVQPHPLGNESMVSIYFECKRKGVEAMKPKINHLKMAEVATFCSRLPQNLFQVINDIDMEVEDRYSKSLLSSGGTEQVMIKRLSDNTHDWVGSIFVEFTHRRKINEVKAQELLHDAAMNIQYILPEYVD